MATLSTTLATLPIDSGGYIVSRKEKWSDDWEFDPYTLAVNAIITIGSHGTGQATLMRDYGSILELGATQRTNRIPLDITGHWIKIEITNSDSNYQDAWIGQVSTTSNILEGNDVTETGIQSFVAYGPGQMLVKKDIDQSTHYDNEEVKTINRNNNFNILNKFNRVVGNRSDQKHNGAYQFGGDKEWSYHDIIEHLLLNYADFTDNDGPKYKLGGKAAEYLKGVKRPIAMNKKENLFDKIRELINPRLGVDFIFKEYTDGFEIYVISRSSRDINYGSITLDSVILPANDNIFNIQAGDTLDMPRVQFFETVDHAYSTIRVVGNRVVVCGSLYLDKDKEGNDRDENTVNLKKGWSDDLETEYNAGSGDAFGRGESANNEAFFETEKFRSVYQLFYAKTTEEFGKPLFDVPGVNSEGEIDTAIESESVSSGLNMMNWIPVKRDFDYSQESVIDGAEIGELSDNIPFQVYIVDENDGYVLAEKRGIAVYPVQNGLGAFVQSNPNHLLGLNSFVSEFDDEISGTPTYYEPRYDYRKIIITLAYRGDYRHKVEYKNSIDDNGSVKVIEVDDAELWLLAPGTVFGTDYAGGAIRPSKERKSISQWLTLRNDNSWLQAVLIGARSQYSEPRGRASIDIERVVPWGVLLGGYAGYIQNGETVLTVNSVVSAVAWDFAGNNTTVMAGNAS